MGGGSAPGTERFVSLDVWRGLSDGRSIVSSGVVWDGSNIHSIVASGMYRNVV